MSDKLVKAKNILKKYNQEHLIMFYNELSVDKKFALLNQILETDFELIMRLYKNSQIDETFDLSTLSPLPHIEKDKLPKETAELYTKML